MRLPLTRAALRDGCRLVRHRVIRRRVGVFGVGAVLAAAPVGGLLLGRALEDALAASLAEPAVARALVAGLVLPTFAAGVALGAIVPSVRALGPQLASAPASTLDHALAMLALPLGACLTAGIALGVPVFLPLASSSPGGPAALLSLGASLTTSLTTGGALGAELAAVRGLTGVRRAAQPLAYALLVPLAATLAAAALAGDAAWWQAVLCATPVSAGALVVWGHSVADGVEPIIRPGWVRSPLGAGPATSPRSIPGLPSLGAALALLRRRREVRTTAIAAVTLGVAGIVIARLGTAPPPSAVLLATTGSALVLAPCALLVGGLVRAAAHVWSLAPRRGIVVIGWSIGSAAVTFAPTLAVIVLAAAVERDPRGVLIGSALVIGVWASALAAGALVPWRRGGVADQAVSLAACAACCAVLSLVAAFVGPRSSALGLPGPVTAVAILGMAIAGATAALAGVLRRGV